MTKVKSWLPILLLLLAVLVWFWPNFTWPGVNITPQVGTNDFTDGVYPIRAKAIEGWRKGEWPLWFGGISAGYPAMSVGNVFYPLKLISLYLPVDWSINFSILTTYFLLGLTGWWLFRQWRLGRWAAFFGALSLTFSGFAVHETVHLEAIVSLTWLLVMIVCWEKYLADKKFFWIVLAGGGLGMQVLGGHSQFAFYGLIFLAGYLVFWQFWHPADWSRLLVGGAIFGLLGATIGAVQLWSTWEATQVSTRASGLAAESILRFNFPVKSLGNFLSPYSDRQAGSSMEAFYQNAWPAEERYVYVGLVGLAMAVWAMVKQRQNPRLIFIIGSGLLFTLLAFGGQTPLKFILLLPPFSFFRLPTQLMMVPVFCLVCLAAFGFQALETRGIKSLILAGIILISFLDLWFWGRQLFSVVPVKQWYQPLAVGEFFGQNLDPQYRVNREHYFYPSARIFSGKPELWGKPETYINWRNLLPDYNGLKENVPLAVGLANAGGIKVGRFNDLEMKMFFGGLRYRDLQLLGMEPWYLPLNRLLAVKHLIVTDVLESPELELAWEKKLENGQGQILIYELKTTQPRAFLVGETKVLPPEEVEATLTDPKFDSQKTLLLEEPVEWAGEKLSKAEVAIIENGEQKIIIKTTADKDAWLFLADVFFPGWVALVDGQPTKIYRANYAFRAVAVAAGEHEVAFKYQPQPFIIGGKISIAGVGAWAAVLTIAKIKYKKSKIKN